MSVAHAMKFIQTLRSDVVLCERLVKQRNEISLPDVVVFAAETGFSFTEDDLRAAYRQDWSMRALRYNLLVPRQE